MTKARLKGSYKDTDRKKPTKKPVKREEKKEESAQDKHKKEHIRRIQLFSSVFGTKRGREALSILMDMAGYGRKDTVFNRNTAELSENSIIYNTARRDYYIDIRDYIRSDILAEVECFGIGNMPDFK